MKTTCWISVLILSAVIFSACAAPPIGDGSNAPKGSYGGQGADLAPDPVNAAKKDLAKQLGIPLGSVSIRTFAVAEWPDSCLGLRNPGENCLDVKTLGYQVELIADGKLYLYHTDKQGKVVRLVTDDKLPEAVQAARQALAAKLNMDAKDIVVTLFTVQDWPNSCLGAAAPGEMCLQVITRGYQVNMQAGGQVYIYHTDETGKSMRLEGDQQQPANPEEPPAIAAARRAIASQLGLADANVKLLKYEAMNWPDSCLGAPAAGENCLQVITPGFKVILGAGNRQYEVHTDQDGKSTRLVQLSTSQTAVIFWRRVGGIAGFCDELQVTITGIAQAFSCKGGQSADLATMSLTGEELQKLVDWSKNWASFEMTEKDPATTDAMQTSLVFTGTGNQIPPDDVKQAMLALAGSLFQRATTKQ